jgi:hypothetical protein
MSSRDDVLIVAISYGSHLRVPGVFAVEEDDTVCFEGPYCFGMP